MIFIIQLLYFICISYKLEEAKQTERRGTPSRLVKQVFPQYKITNFLNIA